VGVGGEMRRPKVLWSWKGVGGLRRLNFYFNFEMKSFRSNFACFIIEINVWKFGHIFLPQCLKKKFYDPFEIVP
jgi:hypothetical protein